MHTPGPWSVGNPPDGTRGYVYCDDATGSAVAQVQFDYVMRSDDEMEANARLIAAAPELLEALRELLAAESALMPPYETGKDEQAKWAERRGVAKDNARAAIAKATGR